MNGNMREYIETGLMSLYDGIQGYYSSLNIIRTEFHEVGITYYLTLDADTVKHDDVLDILPTRCNILKELNMFNLVPLQSVVSFSKGKDLWEVTIAPCLIKDAPDDAGDALLTFIEMAKPTNLNEHISIRMSVEETETPVHSIKANFEYACIGEGKDKFEIGNGESVKGDMYPVKVSTYGQVKRLWKDSFIDLCGVLSSAECDAAVEGTFYGDVINNAGLGWDIANLNCEQKIKWWLVSSYV